MIMHRTDAFLDVATELLQRGHRVRFRAEGGSMRPAIRGGDAIVVEPVASPDIRTDDVVLYRSQRRVIAHRVVRVEMGSDAPPTFTLRGDAPGCTQERVESHQVLGRVAAVESRSWGAKMGDALRNRLNFRSLAAFAILLVALVWLPVAPAYAKATSWNVATGGPWTTVGNWTNGVPAAGDDVTIAIDQSANITAVPAITLNSLVVSGNATLAGAASGNTIAITTTFSVAAGKTLTLGVTGGRLVFTLSATATGTIDGNCAFDAGTTARNFTVAGTLIVTPNGRLYDPVLSTGSRFILNAGATLMTGKTGGISTGTAADSNVAINFGGTYAYNIGANYVFNGVANQTTGNGLPAGVTGTVTINNPGNTVTLNSNESIAAAGALNIVAGTFALGANLTSNGTTTIAAGAAFDQGCTFPLAGTGALTVSGSYINCNSLTAGGTGNLTVGSITVNSGGSFDFVGAASGTPTITLGAGGVVNNGILRIWGGGRNGTGSPVCPGNPPTIVTSSSATVAQPWSGSGNFHLTNLNLTRQNATVAITAWNSTNVVGNTGTWTFTAGTCELASPTAVKVNSFTATQTGNGVRITLQTSRDVNNLGFNLYREVKGQRMKLNASLLAGTALMGGAGTSFTAGQSRRWLDSTGQAGTVYWLEEVDLNSIKTWYGPAEATGAAINGKAMAAGSGPAQALQGANGPMTRAGAQDEELSGALTLSRVGKVGSAAGANASTALKATRSAPVAQGSQIQYALAAGAAVRLGVKEEGWYRVTQPQLVAAGLGPNVNPRNLQLYANGIEQPIYVESASNGRFGAQDAISFYGMGIDSTWSDTQVYWLVAGSDHGARMDVGNAAGGRVGAVPGAASFPATVAWKPRTLYIAALLNGDGSNFFGPVVTDVPVSQALTASRLNAAGGASTLQVKLQGATAGAHMVTVALNGTELGKAFFSGQDSVVATYTVPAVNEGANLLALTAANQDDVSVVDEVRLTYPHRYTADGDALRFTAQAGSPTTIDGFSVSSVTAIDITDAANPSLVRGQMSGSASNYALTLVPSGDRGTRTLLAVGGGQLGTPTITANKPSSWNAARTGYDMVIVGHASLLSSAAPLAALRQSQGLKVAVIDVQDLYDEFNFGMKSPYALRAFLSAAKANWTVKPRFVLLLGNGTVDPRNYLDTSVPDLVPTKLVDTRLLETASDDWFVDFNDDGIPDMAIGRLPAESIAAANAMVGRTVAYDRPVTAPWTNRALLVSGSNQDPTDDFAGLSSAMQASLPAAIGVTHLAQGSDPNPAGNLIAGINAGQALVNYIGHGSVEVWGGGLFDSTAALGLANGAMTPVFLSMTCLNGYFHDVYTTALGKALLNAPGGGAVAVWASSGLSEPGPQSAMNQVMVRALYGSPEMTIGQAAAAAKAATSDMDVRRTWILLGDPSALLQ